MGASMGRRGAEWRGRGMSRSAIRCRAARGRQGWGENERCFLPWRRGLLLPFPPCRGMERCSHSTHTLLPKVMGSAPAALAGRSNMDALLLLAGASAAVRGCPLDVRRTD